MAYIRGPPASVSISHACSRSDSLRGNPSCSESMAIQDISTSYATLRSRSDLRGSACEYAGPRSNEIPQIHQQMVQAESCTQQLDSHPIIDGHPPRNPPLAAAHLPLRERPSSSSGSSNPFNPSKEEHRSQWCLCVPDAKAPRPRNAFILYRQHHQAAVIAKNPGTWNQDISKIIGNQWRQLTDNQKSEWKEMARQEELRHAEQYPTYRYRPNKAGGTRNAHHLDPDSGHNLSCGSKCDRCGRKRLKAPTSPMNSFTAPEERSTVTPARVEVKATTVGRSQEVEQELRPIRIGPIDHGKRGWISEEAGDQFQSSKRPQYNTSPEQQHQQQQQQRQILPSITPPFDTDTCLDSSLKLAPLKPSAPIRSPFTTMKIPGFKKFEFLDKKSQSLQPSFCRTPTTHGPIIAIDGQDLSLVQCALSYLGCMLEQDGKHCLRIFHGPVIKEPTAEIPFDPKAEYLHELSAWYRVSEEIKDFVSTPSQNFSCQKKPQEASYNGSEHTVSTIASSTALPIALVSQYNFTTPDAIACSVPIQDVCTSLKHWKLMSGLWQTCVSPDITLYIRECGLRELRSSGPVTTRLQEDGTITIWRLIGSPEPLKKEVLERAGIQIKDFLTQ